MAARPTQPDRVGLGAVTLGPCRHRVTSGYSVFAPGLEMDYREASRRWHEVGESSATHNGRRFQLGVIVHEFDSARDRLHSLARRVPQEQWTQRPDRTRWSIAECVVHLNLTSSVQLAAPSRRHQPGAGFAGPRAGAAISPGSDRVAPVEDSRSAGSISGTDHATVRAGSRRAREDLITEFGRLQEEQLTLTRDAAGLPIDRIKIASPFYVRPRYNLYAALTILPRHQHRHLWQAEQVWHRLCLGTTR